MFRLIQDCSVNVSRAGLATLFSCRIRSESAFDNLSHAATCQDNLFLFVIPATSVSELIFTTIYSR